MDRSFLEEGKMKRFISVVICSFIITIQYHPTVDATTRDLSKATVQQMTVALDGDILAVSLFGTFQNPCYQISTFEVYPSEISKTIDFDIQQSRTPNTDICAS